MRTPETCKWLEGGPIHFRRCGRRAVADKPYCGKHIRAWVESVKLASEFLDRLKERGERC